MWFVAVSREFLQNSLNWAFGTFAPSCFCCCCSLFTKKTRMCWWVSGKRQEWKSEIICQLLMASAYANIRVVNRGGKMSLICVEELKYQKRNHAVCIRAQLILEIDSISLIKPRFRLYLWTNDKEAPSLTEFSVLCLSNSARRSPRAP